MAMLGLSLSAIVRLSNKPRRSCGRSGRRVRGAILCGLLWDRSEQRTLPADGPLSKEAPSSPNDIRLILGGKYVDAGKTLKEYRKDMGDIGLDSVVFFHMIVRPVPNPAKAGGVYMVHATRVS
ncbi:hypothetical protein QJQ45_002778 [Haematococcus lacustris]|nr:hypothetical protein QJQ45_002778 [Haematococcus lacustris]